MRVRDRRGSFVGRGGAEKLPPVEESFNFDPENLPSPGRGRSRRARRAASVVASSELGPMTKNSSSPWTRRAFLTGVGTTGLALPFLEGLPERSAFAADDDPRFAFFICAANGVVQNGQDPERFWPTEAGPLTRARMEADSAERCTGLLAEHADQLLLVRGITYPMGTVGDTHARGHCMCLTGLPPNGASSAGATLATGPSADWVIARATGGTPLTLYAGRRGGYVDERLSFRAAGELVAAEADPYQVYLRLAGLLDPRTGGPSPLATELARRRRSVNDLVFADFRRLMMRPELSRADRDRLDLHLTSLREIEQQLPVPTCSAAELDLEEIRSIGPSGYIEDVARLQMQLAGLAFSCNLHRAATLQWGNSGGDGSRYLIDGVLSERFHWISHRISSDGSTGAPIPGAMELHAEIDRIRMRTFETMLACWRDFTTPQGPLLERSFALWTSEVAEGPGGPYVNLPIILAGSAGGRLKQGQFLNLEERTLNARLLTSLIEACGVDASDFADGLGGLPEILA